VLQTALTKTYLAWRRLGEIEAVEAYARRVLVTTATSWWRRRWHGERPTKVMPDRALPDVLEERIERQALWWHVCSLPARQRAAGRRQPNTAAVSPRAGEAGVMGLLEDALRDTLAALVATTPAVEDAAGGAIGRARRMRRRRTAVLGTAAAAVSMVLLGAGVAAVKAGPLGVAVGVVQPTAPGVEVWSAPLPSDLLTGNRIILATGAGHLAGRPAAGPAGLADLRRMAGADRG
jgi:hypothetical protein